jgi:hypothetical protein
VADECVTSLPPGHSGVRSASRHATIPTSLPPIVRSIGVTAQGARASSVGAAQSSCTPTSGPAVTPELLVGESTLLQPHKPPICRQKYHIGAAATAAKHDHGNCTTTPNMWRQGVQCMVSCDAWQSTGHANVLCGQCDSQLKHLAAGPTRARRQPPARPTPVAARCQTRRGSRSRRWSYAAAQPAASAAAPPAVRRVQKWVSQPAGLHTHFCVKYVLETPMIPVSHVSYSADAPST